MQKLLGFVCFCLAVSLAYCGLERLPKQDVPPKYEGQPGCYNPSLDVMLPYDVLYSDPAVCKGYLCQQSDGVTQIQTCPVYTGPKECLTEEDLSAPYPDCCVKVIPNCGSEVSGVA